MPNSELVTQTYQKIENQIREEAREKFLVWLERVIEYALVDEPKFTPNTAQLKEAWEFGSSAICAAEDGVYQFRQ